MAAGSYHVVGAILTALRVGAVNPPISQFAAPFQGSLDGSPAAQLGGDLDEIELKQKLRAVERELIELQRAGEERDEHEVDRPPLP